MCALTQPYTCMVSLPFVGYYLGLNCTDAHMGDQCVHSSGSGSVR
jgi:hypothetical protein